MKKKILCILLLIFAVKAGASTGRSIYNFDFDWLFSRYGLQADGTRLEEPVAAESILFDDRNWKQLDLPHDWAIEGPFRPDLEGFTGKLPWRGIGWYRKHFKVVYGGENVVAVRLNTEDMGSRWYPGAGIYRHVRLVKTSQVHVDHWGVFITTPQISDKEAKAVISVKLRNHLPDPVKGHYAVSVYVIFLFRRMDVPATGC